MTSDDCGAIATGGLPVADWLEAALARRPQSLRVATGRSEVELLLWGERGLPGVFLLHGAGAHAHWWDGVAPLLAREHRVAAMSLPGNGTSDWRDHYASADFFADALACAAAGSLDAVGKPVFVGHSMGGAHLMHGAVHSPETMRGLVLVDTSFRSPALGGPPAARSRHLYATEAEALDRFRLTPPGQAREEALVRHVAGHSMMRVPGPNGETRWCWRADPAYWSKFRPGIEQGPYAAPLRPLVPTAHMIAERSHVAEAAAGLPLGKEVARVMLPECGHHVMLDRPLLLVAALRTLLATWP